MLIPCGEEIVPMC